MSLEKLEPTFEPTMFRSLKTIALQHKKRLFATFGLVAAENLLLLIYPLVGSFAVNAVLNKQLVSALAYALIVLIIWGVGATRRAVDTRAFTRIYTELAVPVILNQRIKGIDTSTTTARVALSHYVKVNDRLYFKLNKRLEKEVDRVERAKNSELIKHYRLVERFRILISNREAFGFLCIGMAMCLLFGVTLTVLTLKQGVTAGHIYAVITYLWTFAISLDDAPRLVEELSKLKDIGRRVEIE